MTAVKYRDLQFSSKSPVVLSVGNRLLSREKRTSRGKVNSYEIEHFAWNLLQFLWIEHQSFRSLLCSEVEEDHWVLFFGDILQQRLFAFDLSVVAQVRVFASITDVVRGNAKDLHGISIRTAFPWHTAYLNNTFPFDGRSFTITGPKHELLVELARRLNNKWMVMAKLNANGSQKICETCETEMVEIVYKMVVGRIEFAPLALGLKARESRTLDLLPASAETHKLILLVPPARKLWAWSLPLRVFSARIWLALLGAAVAYALAWRVVAGESLAASAAAALRAFSSCGGAPQDRVRATPQRLQLAAALLASAVVVVAAYQGRLFTLITHPQFSQEIDTIDQLVESRLPVYSTGVAKIAQQIKMDAHDYTFRERSAWRQILFNITRTTSADVAKMLAQGLAFAWILREEDWNTISRTVHVSGMLRPMKAVSVDATLYMRVRRNWPWIDTLNQKLYDFHAAGLLDKWEEVYTRQKNDYYTVAGDVWATQLGVHALNRSEAMQLHVNDFLPHLQLLCAGLVGSALTFCAEIVTNRKLARRD